MKLNHYLKYFVYLLRILYSTIILGIFLMLFGTKIFGNKYYILEQDLYNFLFGVRINGITTQGKYALK